MRIESTAGTARRYRPRRRSHRLEHQNASEIPAPSSLATRRATVVGLVVGLPASLLFLWLAFRTASFGDVWDAARGADKGLVALVLVPFTALYLLQGIRWRILAGSDRPGALGFAEMVVAGVGCNNVLPGRVGELFRARWLAVAAPMPSGRALATVALDRGSDVVVLFSFLVVSLPFVIEAAWVKRVLLGTAAVLVVLALLLVLARGYARLRKRDRHERGRLRRIVRDLVDTLAEPLGRRRVAKALFLGTLAWGAFTLAVWLVARSLGIELDLLDCIFVTSVINLGVAIPSSPGFVGTYQWLAVASLAAFDVVREEALAFSILLHASWYAPTTVIGGLLVLFRLRWGVRMHA